MSSRVLRKLGLQGEKDITSLGDDASDTEDFSSSGGAKKKQLNINRYDLVILNYCFKWLLDSETYVIKINQF